MTDHALSLSGERSSEGRREYVLETLAGILIAATQRGQRSAMVTAGCGCARDFTDDLAAALHSAGASCELVTDPAAPEHAGKPDEILLFDAARAPLARAEGIHIYLRTPPPPDTIGTRRSRHGDGEHGADIVIDYHDPSWPVIRHVSPGLIHPSERLYLAETQAFFGPRAVTWNNKFGDDLPAYRAAVAESDVRSGATIVDVGCGTGRALPALRAAAGPDGLVVGLDVTAEMLAVAARDRGGDDRLVMADARRLPLADGSADVVFAAGLIQHLPHAGAGLAELARITRPGGKLIIFHPSGRAALAARHGRTLSDDEPLHRPNLDRLLTGAGWRLTRYDDPPERFYALADRQAESIGGNRNGNP